MKKNGHRKKRTCDRIAGVASAVNHPASWKELCYCSCACERREQEAREREKGRQTKIMSGKRTKGMGKDVDK